MTRHLPSRNPGSKAAAGGEVCAPVLPTPQALHLRGTPRHHLTEADSI